MGDLVQTYCVEPSRVHTITVTLTDDTVYKFRPTFSPQCQRFTPPETGTVSFAALDGTTASLAAVGSSDVLVVGGGFPGPLELQTVLGGPFDPTQFDLTLKDGRILRIDTFIPAPASDQAPARAAHGRRRGTNQD